MKRTTTILLLTLLPILLGAQTPTLENALKRIHNARTLVATFTGNLEGRLTMDRDKFTIHTPAVTTTYDGHTLWSYVADTREINITEPDNDELATTNPYMLLKNYKKLYTLTRRGDTTILTPKEVEQIKSIEVEIDKKSDIRSISITTTDDRHLHYHITQLRLSSKIPASTFQFDPSDYPEAEVIDLR